MSKMIHASLWGVNLVPGDRFLPRCVCVWGGAVLLIELSRPSLVTHAQRDCIVKISSFSLDMDWIKGALFMI